MITIDDICFGKFLSLNYPPMRTILLLFLSNLFMTTAWYWHLKFRETDLWKVILISWLIAFVEYCIAVPANRIGSYSFNAFELKTIQEVVSLAVFVAFAVFYLKEPVRWNYLVGFGLIVLAVYFIFKKW
ncbi:DMT family protein [Telluribacter humicola]